MMYGFGDVKNPEDETVNLMQELVFEYIREMTFKASEVASKRGKIQPEDLVFVIRKDRKKYARAIELLSMNEELKRARKQFDSRI
uniref:Transcription initiation factor TFIID subunit 13 n=1 Tax=Arcella intermedia TaxID=1963864 RepID=A0A6B2LV85_9EUKA